MSAVGTGAGGGAPGLAERMDGFRSLGGNCEFGFVQRYCGAEPSGLFRFSFTPLDHLVHALDGDFERYGAPGDLHLVETETGHYYCASRTYDFWSNTQRTVGSVAPDALLEREYSRVAHLKRKMLEELARASKILVRKAAPDEDEDDMARLARAVWRHGPSTLLRVAQGPPAGVARVSDRVLLGSLPRLAPQERAWEVDLEPWVALCDAAYALHHGVPEAALVAAPAGDAMRLPQRAARHRGRHRDPALSAFTQALDPRTFDPRRPYCFSAWVWIPAEASPTRVFAVLGRDRLGWHDADLTVRDRWQRVWAAGRIDSGQTRPSVGLAMVGGRADRFRSCGWRLHDGPMPETSAVPPPERAAPWLARWFSARRA